MRRLLRRLLHQDENRCRFASGSHGHATRQSRNAATRSDGLSASCFEHAADRFQDTH
jgi:hypothetical protein